MSKQQKALSALQQQGYTLIQKRINGRKVIMIARAHSLVTMAA